MFSGKKPPINGNVGIFHASFLSDGSALVASSC